TPPRRPSRPAPAEASVPAAPVETDDEEESPRLRPVDSPTLPAPGITTYKRLPILPSWLTSKPGFVSTTQRAASNAFYATAFHGVRTPVYVLQLGLRAPQGVARLVKETNRWMWDAEAAPLRAYEVYKENTAEYLKLSRQRDHRVRLRTFVTLVGIVFGAGLALTLYVMAPA
ncbi:cell division protein FtsK, partial [Streptomyces sp. MBT57]|nr:cell division protein FtsK [Streptomyces sp. MBT57]